MENKPFLEVIRMKKTVLRLVIVLAMPVPKVCAAPARQYLEEAHSYQKRGQYEEAIVEYTRALDEGGLVDNEKANAYCNRGKAYHRLGDSQRAIPDLRKAIDLRPDYVDALISLGIAYTGKGNYDGAIEVYTKIIALKADSATAYNNRGVAYFRKGEYDEALSDYTKATELRPDHALAYNNRGISHRQKGDYDSAIIDHTTAIEIKLEYTDAYNGRGYAYYLKDDYARATKDYNRAIKIAEAALATNRYENGLAYCQMGDYGKAIDNFTKAIELEPDNAVRYDKRGWAYYLNQDYHLAIEDYKKAIELKPDFADAMNHLSICNSFAKTLRDLIITDKEGIAGKVVTGKLRCKWHTPTKGHSAYFKIAVDLPGEYIATLPPIPAGGKRYSVRLHIPVAILDRKDPELIQEDTVYELRGRIVKLKDLDITLDVVTMKKVPGGGQLQVFYPHP